MKNILNKIKDFIIVLSGFIAFILLGVFIEWLCIDMERAKTFAIIGCILVGFILIKISKEIS